MKKSFFCLLPILCSLAKPFANPTAGRSLGIGQLVPNITTSATATNGIKILSLSDFKGKHILLDFFATTCASCVMALPKMDSLQKEYKDSIQIIIVTTDKQEKISSLLKRIQQRHAVSLPFITDDSVLCKFFPHRLLPHEVLLDGNRKVTAITAGWEITRANINKMLTEPNFRFPLKKDAMDFDRQLPLLENDNGGDNGNILYRSTVTGFLDGLGGLSGYVKNPETNSQRLYLINYTIPRLYMISLGVNLPNSRVVLEVQDSLRFTEINEFKTTGKSYCYEQVSPISLGYNNCLQGMRLDLDRFFNLKGKLEKRTTNCYIITKKTGAQDAPKDPSGMPGCNSTVSSLTKELNADVLFTEHAPIFLDETGEPQHIAPVFDAGMHNIQVLNAQLAIYGLVVSEAMRPVDMLVISDK